MVEAEWVYGSSYRYLIAWAASSLGIYSSGPWTDRTPRSFRRLESYRARQMYFPEGRPLAVEMLHRVKMAGYTAIVVTVDATVFSNRERTTRLLGSPLPNLPMGNSSRTAGVTGTATAAKVDLTWDDIEFCQKASGLTVIVKSILSTRQAAGGGAPRLCIRHRSAA